MELTKRIVLVNSMWEIIKLTIIYSVTRPNHVRIIPYGVFGVSKLTITAISVESSVAIIQALKPSETARIPLSIRKYSRIPLTIPATAPYSFARFQKSPSRTTWKKTTVRPPVA